METKNNLKLAAILIAILFIGVGASLAYFAYQSAALSKKNQDLTQKLESIQPGFEKLSQQEQELENKYTHLLKEHEAVKLDRDNVLAQVKNLLGEKSRAQELAGSLEKMNSAIGALQKEKQEIQNSNLSLKEEIKQLKEEEIKIAKERDDFKLAYEKAKKDTAIKELKKELANLQKEKNSLEGSLQKEKNSLEGSLKKAQKDIAQLTEQRAKLEGEKAQLTEELNKYKTNFADALKKNKALGEEIQNIPKKFSEIARQNKRLIRESAEMHYNLGVFYTKNKEYEQAIAEFEKVVEVTPDDYYAHFNLGYIYAEYRVNRQKAIEHFRHFLRLAKSGDKDIEWVKKYLLTWETYEGKRPME